MFRLNYSVFFLFAFCARNGLANASTDSADDLQDFDFGIDPAPAPPTVAASAEELLLVDAEKDVRLVDTADKQPLVLTINEKEKRLREALLRITADKENRQTLTQILPILRGLSKSQRTVLAAIVTAQASQRHKFAYKEVSQSNLLALHG